MGQKRGNNIIIAAGGSGGHIFPAKALASELSRRDAGKIYFVASKRRLDKNILSDVRQKCYFLSANPMPRGFHPVKVLVFIGKMISDLLSSFSILTRVRPSVVVGFGGYSSGAILLCSKFFGIKILIHEQNLLPGRANLLLGKMADRIATSFQASDKFFKRWAGKCVFTGNPLRNENLKGERASSAERLNMSLDKKTVLIMGGSQGSAFLNRTCSQAALIIRDSLGDDVQFLHLTGQNDYEDVRDFYMENNVCATVISFLENIGDAYAVADIAVSRSGAAAVFELALSAKPMILVPYPNPKNNQRTNAAYFSDKGAAVYKNEKELTASRLALEVVSILSDDDRRIRLSGSAKALSVPDASKRLADEVISLMRQE